LTRYASDFQTQEIPASWESQRAFSPIEEVSTVVSPHDNQSPTRVPAARSIESISSIGQSEDSGEVEVGCDCGVDVSLSPQDSPILTLFCSQKHRIMISSNVKDHVNVGFIYGASGRFVITDT
jgi:hypothetical protein